jgi:hypothetical protein
MKPPEELARVFTPIPWPWEDKDPQQAAWEVESQPPLLRLPPMPGNRAYDDARLETLIREAQESYGRGLPG